MRNFFAINLLVFLLFSCAKDDDYDKKKAISVFTEQEKINIDATIAKEQIAIPQQKNITSTDGNFLANSQIENFAKTFSFTKKNQITIKKKSQFWSFYSANFSDHFVFSPIVKNHKIFALEPSGILISYDLVAEKKIWQKRIFPRQFLKNYQNPKITYFGGVIFAIIGTNKVAAISEDSGDILWSKEISAIPLSTPLSDGEKLYILTNDNKLYALNAKNGDLYWIHSGVFRPAAISGAADLLFYQNSVIASYSSGEIYAIDKNSGESLWSNSLNLSRAINSDFYLNDIDATPIIKNDVIYAVGNGGFMAAMSAKDGSYFWKKELSSLSNFWLSGDFLFVINNENKLLAIHKKNGGIRWIAQLPDYKNTKKPQTKYIYNGLIMAGNELILSRFDGELLLISPLDGSLKGEWSIGKKISHSPIISDGKLYFYSLGRFFADLVEIQ